MLNTLDKIINGGLLVLVFLIPLFFLPLTSDFYDFNKNILLVVTAGLLLLAWGLKMFLENGLRLKRTPFDLPVVLIAVTYLLSTFIVSPNKIEVATLPGGTGTVVALTVLYFVVVNAGLSTLRLLGSLLTSASALSLLAVYQFIGLGETLIPADRGLDWLRVKTFSPAGGPLVLATFLVVCLSIALTKLFTDVKTGKKNLSFYLTLLAFLFNALGLGVSLYQLLTTAKPLLLPQQAGWVIALEAFKSFPFLGVGPENFVSAFTAGKPLGLNLTNSWALRFGVSSNFYFHLLTTVGILGLGAWLFLIGKVIKEIKILRSGDSKTVLCLGLLLVFLLLVFLPSNFLLLTTTYLLLALLGKELATAELKEESKAFVGTVFLIVTVLVLFSFYWTGRILAAELFFGQSLRAASQNRGTDTYNLQIKAIQNNPYQPIYRIGYSQTNLALANAIASNAPAGGLSDQDRQNISILVQQAIREAKAAVALNTGRVTHWENLASLYRSLINFAQGADQWTIAAYNQAIALDPANPLLRLSLGGVFYGLKNYDAAIQQFTLTVNLKPDYANGHYNLAAAFKEKGNFVQAVAAMERVQTLVEPGTNDYQKATQELEELRAKLPPTEKATEKPIQTGETLTPPATPSAGLKPPLSLPEEAQPPTEATESGR